MKRLLYDLHNEVLEAAEIRINTEHSLTTREGVSPVLSFAQSVSLTPSLHVKVYRPCTKATRRETGSLTTREGVSEVTTMAKFTTEFPHYT